MRLIRLLIFSVLLFSGLVCLGQRNLSGVVYSKLTGKPIPDFAFRMGKRKLIIADSLGFFNITTEKNRLKIFPEFISWQDTTLLTDLIDDTIRLYFAYPIGADLARYDIDNNHIQFYCGGGISPMAMKPADKEFQTKYSVIYHMLDCFMPSVADLNSYNQVMALYLDNKFGTDWRKKVRMDIFGVTRAVGYR